MGVRSEDHVAVYLMHRLVVVVHVDGPRAGALVDRSADLDGWDVVRVLSATVQCRRASRAPDAVEQRGARTQSSTVRGDLVAGGLVAADRKDGEPLIGGRPVEHVPGELGRTPWAGTRENGR